MGKFMNGNTLGVKPTRFLSYPEREAISYENEDRTVNKSLFLSLLMLASAGTLTCADSVPQWGRWEQAYTAAPLRNRVRSGAAGNRLTPRGMTRRQTPTSQ